MVDVKNVTSFGRALIALENELRVKRDHRDANLDDKKGTIIPRIFERFLGDTLFRRVVLPVSLILQIDEKNIPSFWINRNNNASCARTYYYMYFVNLYLI